MNRERLTWLLRIAGPAYLVAVGYMDPGNWATDLAAGSRYGYALLWVVVLSSAMAMLLQSLCCRFGLATGLDLAEACRLHLPRRSRIPLWLLAESESWPAIWPSWWAVPSPCNCSSACR